jgi:hypothetical protein
VDIALPYFRCRLVDFHISMMRALAVSGIWICEAFAARIISRMIPAISGEFSLAIASPEFSIAYGWQRAFTILLLLSGSPVLRHFLTGDDSDQSSHLQCTSGSGFGAPEFVARVAER